MSVVQYTMYYILYMYYVCTVFTIEYLQKKYWCLQYDILCTIYYICNILHMYYIYIRVFKKLKIVVSIVQYTMYYILCMYYVYNRVFTKILVSIVQYTV